MANYSVVNDTVFTTAFKDPIMIQICARWKSEYVSIGPGFNINKASGAIEAGKQIGYIDPRIKAYWCESNCYHTFSHSGLLALMLCNQHFEEQNSLLVNEAGYCLVTDLMEFLVPENKNR